MSTDSQAEAQWLEDRKKGIGGSDAPRVLLKPYPLWAEKAGLIEPDDLSDLEWVEWGHRLEDVILEAYAEKSGRSVMRAPLFESLVHPDYPWMRCTPDAMQDFEGRRGIVQVKTTGAWFAADWKDEPPLSYQVQIMHEMEVTQVSWGTLLVLIGGQKLRWFDLERNDKFITALVREEQDFWRRVVENDPPPVDDSKATTAALKKLYATEDGETIALPPAATVWDDELVETKAKLKELEKTRNLLENRLREAIGHATAGMLADGIMYTHKVQTTNHPAKEAYSSTFRVLRRKKPK